MDQDLSTRSLQSRPKRTLSLSFLAVSLLVLSLFGWLRLQQAVFNWDFLVQLDIHPGPLYLAAGGTLWGVLGLTAAVSLWYRLSWSVMITEVTVLVFAASYWLDRLALSHSAGSQTNLYFAIGLTIIGLIYAFGVSETLKRAFS
ncbi:MAG: hypothetical protein P4L50_27280 [Anaerolineaceae bacterium]|nr:hypothetical protein [Anaerolineaceae bacterium]